MKMLQLTKSAMLATFARLALAVAALLTSFALPAPAIAEDNVPPLKILALGDSLTAGYMLKPGESFPAQLQMALEKKGYKVRVINAGVSGDTTTDGLNRLDWTLAAKPDAAIVELGANDALRGLKPELARKNLDKILKAMTAAKMPVLIAGMKAPGNWGAEYAAAFDTIFPDLAKKYDATLYPFFLEGVALDPKLVLDDGLHPSAAGVAEIVKRILPDVEALVEKTRTAKSAASN